MVFLLDNSASSINGDFFPSRLVSQLCVLEEVIRQQQERRNVEIAIGAVAGDAPGILHSLTRNGRSLLQALADVQCGGEIRLQYSIRSSFLALRYAEQRDKKLIVFVGAGNDLNQSNYMKIAEEANRNEVELYIITLGSDVDNTELLYDLVRNVERKSALVILEPYYNYDELIYNLGLFDQNNNLCNQDVHQLFDLYRSKGQMTYEESLATDKRNIENYNEQTEDEFDDPDLDYYLLGYTEDDLDNNNNNNNPSK